MTTQTEALKLALEALAVAKNMAAFHYDPELEYGFQCAANELENAFKEALAQPEQEPTYTSTQATNCAGCGEHKHTPLRIDAMGGYVCLTCINKKLGSLLGEFGYEQPEQEPVAAIQHWCTYCQGHNIHNCQFNMQLPRFHTYTTNNTATSQGVKDDKTK